jgi:gas vesicle protein
MAEVQEAVRRLRVEARDDGITATADKVKLLASSERDLEAAQVSRAAKNEQMIQQYDKMQSLQEQYARSQQQQIQTLTQMQAANDNVAQSHGHVLDAVRAGTKAALDYAAGWAETVGAVGAAMLVFGRLVSVLSQVILIYKATKLAIDLVSEAWELGGKRLDEYRQIAEKAAAVDLSTTYFQRLTKGAEDAKVPVDELTKMLANLQKVSADQLGGSQLQQRLDQHLDAGNFATNPGVAMLAQANTVEERFKAIATLIHQAMEDGQRLAALDIAGTALGPEAADHLRQDSEYLDKILAAAGKVSETRLVSDADVGRALELQRRYDAAVTILEQRWHPIQNALTDLGVKMHEAWVGIVEAIAQAVDQIYKFVGKIGEIAQPFWDFVKPGVNAAANVVARVAPGAPGIPGVAIGAAAAGVAAATAPDQVRETDAYADAVARLRAGLQNQYEVQRKVNEANTVAQKTLGDTSHKLNEEIDDQKDAYDRAVESVRKHIAQLTADNQAIGLGVGAMQEFRTAAALRNAAEAAGIPLTQQVIDQINSYAKAVGTLAQANAQKSAQQRADFAQQTLFLSDTERQIAAVQQQLHGDAWKDFMNDGLAATMRLTAAIKDVRDASVEFGQSLVQGLLQGKSLMDSVVAAADQLASSLANDGVKNLLSFNPAQMGMGALQLGASALISAFTGDQKSKKELDEAKQQWASMADQVTKFNLAAKGVDLGPLTNELNSLYSTFTTLVNAAIKAQDNVSAGNLAGSFDASVARIINEFANGTQTLSPLQQQIKGVNDEAAGLKDTLNQLNATGWRNYPIDAIDAAAQAQIKALVAQFTDTVTQGLQERLNTAQGKGYLNDATALLAQHQQDLVNAADLGNDPALLAQIAAVFQAEAQKIVQDAGLVGDQFADFIKLFPQLGDVVKQATVDVTDSIKTIQQYLESLQVGSNSILSPEDQLKAAQDNFGRQLALAQGGDADALGSITNYAQTLLDQAKGFYASSDGYAAIYQAVTAALAALAGPAAYAPSSSSQAASAPSAASPLGSAMAAASGNAANDNGQNFAQLSQTFIQASGANAQAQIAALQAAVDVLGAKLDRIGNAAEAANRRGQRPAQKAG